MTCVLCNRQTIVGLLCAPDFDRLAQQLNQIERETQQLSAVPSMAQPQGSRGGTLASHRAPARLDALVLTDPRTTRDEHGTVGVLGVLGSWARVVRDDRQLTWPERITVASERKTLVAQLDWIAAQPWVDEFAHELHALLRQLQRTNGTAPEPPAGRCYLPIDGDKPCAGPIWLEHEHARCGRCGSEWDGPYLARLKWEMDRQEAENRRPRTHDGRPMLTAQELANQHGITVNAVRIRLSRARARANGSHYDPGVLGIDVAS